FQHALGGAGPRLGAPDRQQPRLGSGSGRLEALARPERAGRARGTRLFRTDQSLVIRGPAGRGDGVVSPPTRAGDGRSQDPTSAVQSLRTAPDYAPARSLRGQCFAGPWAAVACL